MIYPTVSVIVPTKDRPDLLLRALESIAAQDYTGSIEAIVVDDGSAVVQDWVLETGLELDVRLVRHDVSRDLAGARNAGLREARGTYVGYLDDDDVWLPHHARTLVAALEASPARAAYSIAERWSQERRGTEWVTVDAAVEHDRATIDMPLLLVTNLTPVNTVLHERSLIDSIGGFDETLTVLEDWDMWIRMRDATDFVHVPEVTCAYTTRPTGNMTQQRSQSFWPTQSRIYGRYADIAHRYPGLVDLQRRTLEQLLAQFPQQRQHELRTAAARQLAAPASDRTLYEASEDQPDPIHFAVSLVLPVRADLATTLAALTSIVDGTGERGYEVVVVEDGADEDTRTLLGSLEGDVRIVHHETVRGLGASYLTGVEHASAAQVVLLDPAVIVQPGWLTPLMDALPIHDAPADVASATSRTRTAALIGNRVLLSEALTMATDMSDLDDLLEAIVVDGDHRAMFVPASRADVGAPPVRSSHAA
ncbi:MAG: hypothetical protein JWM25_215 [Thermoleophilia bacterium]|nr:hypothetical protein [Thermoleophilia bacterium]